MIKSLGFALTSAGLLLASQQAMALSVSANAGADSHGIEASQSIFPTCAPVSATFPRTIAVMTPTLIPGR